MSLHRDQLDALRKESQLDAAATARVHARLARPQPARPVAGVRIAWGFGVALAAAATFVLWPAPPSPVDRSFGDVGEASLGADVHARWDGRGAVRGDARTMEVAWEAGAIDVEVTPHAGVHFELTTGEAHLRVVGTGFQVLRDAFGTTVTVAHGIVAVQCTGEAEVEHPAGDSVTCLPTSPAALVGRARAQQRRGDPPDAVLATLDRAADPDGSTAGELSWIRASELHRAGRDADALQVADLALRSPDPARRTDLLRLSTRLAAALGRCPDVSAHVAALHAAGEATPCDPPSPGAP